MNELFLPNEDTNKATVMKLYARAELCINLVHDIALICKESMYPEDLEEIYDLLTNNGIDYKRLEDNERWLK